MPETPPTLATSSQSAVVTLATTNVLGNQQPSNPAVVTLAAKPTDKSIPAQPVAGETPLNDKDSASSQNRSSNKPGDDGVLGDDPSAVDDSQRYDAGAHVVTLS